MHSAAVLGGQRLPTNPQAAMSRRPRPEDVGVEGIARMDVQITEERTARRGSTSGRYSRVSTGRFGGR